MSSNTNSSTGSSPGGKSPSIPVPKRSQIRSEHSAAKEIEATSLADYRDFQFFSRLVEGIEREQARRRCDDLKLENDKCLERIISTRTEGSLVSYQNATEETLQQHNGNPVEESYGKDVLDACYDGEEELMFHLEL